MISWSCGCDETSLLNFPLQMIGRMDETGEMLLWANVCNPTVSWTLSLSFILSWKHFILNLSVSDDSLDCLIIWCFASEPHPCSHRWRHLIHFSCGQVLTCSLSSFQLKCKGILLPIWEKSISDSFVHKKKEHFQLVGRKDFKKTNFRLVI